MTWPMRSRVTLASLPFPDPPVQAVDFRDDHGPGVLPLRGVGRQVASCLLGMLQPHGDVEPVKVRRRRDAGIDQDRAQSGTAVGECRQLGILGLADLLEAAPDQRLDRGVGPGDRGEDLARAIRCLVVAEADFQMPLAVLAAADIG